MKQTVVIVFLFIALVLGCSLLGWWFAKKFLQRQVDDFDRARTAADILNTQAALERANAALAAAEGRNGGAGA
jgi:predicted permease